MYISVVKYFYYTDCAPQVLALVYISNPENVLYPTEFLMYVPSMQSLRNQRRWACKANNKYVTE